MDASAIMTRGVVTVAPDTAISDVAKIMIDKQISGVPVLDRGSLVGLISEGDLVRRAEIGSEHRRSRWMELAFSNPKLAADYAKEYGRKAADVMTRDVITVAPSTPVGEIANILATRHIKRVPVVAKGELVGIVSRANLIQALATNRPSSAAGTARDHDIQEAIFQEMRNRRWTLSPTEANVIVHNNEVHLWGYIGSEEARRATIVIAENIPGVRRVHDHMEYPLIFPPMT